MPGEQATGGEAGECVLDYGGSCFECDPGAPVLGTEMEAEFMDAEIGLVWPEPAAAGMLMPIAQENRPVLKAVFPLKGDLRPETLPDLAGREGAAEKRGDARVAPQGKGEREVVVAQWRKPIRSVARK